MGGRCRSGVGAEEGDGVAAVTLVAIEAALGFGLVALDFRAEELALVALQAEGWGGGLEE